MPQQTGYIIDRVSTRSETFQYFQPISNSVTANYEEASVRGRSEPHPFYIDTSTDEYTFDIKLLASVDEGDLASYKIVHDKYLFIKSFQYPDYGDGRLGPVRPPRQVIIAIGSWFRKRGIIKNTTFQFNAPYSPEGYPYSIDCRFTLREFNAVARGRDIISNTFGNDPSTPGI